MKTMPHFIQRYYEAPYRFDDVKYVWDNNNYMILMGDYNSKLSSNVIERVTNLLNGIPTEPKDINDVYTLKDGDIFLNDEYAICIRGWGRIQQIDDNYYTPEQIQDTFAQYIVDLLNE